MLELKIGENRIYLRDHKKTLKSYQQLNLKFLKFSFKDDSYILNDFTTEQVLELTQYLSEENIEFEIDQNSKNILNHIFNLRIKFNDQVEKCRSIKNGLVDSNEFNNFLDLTRKLILRPLKTHQKKAVYHLLNCRNGANFSVPGSGKTTVALTIYQILKNDDKVNTLFVVGPPASFYPWKNEFYENIGYAPNYTILPGLEKTERKIEYYNTTELRELYLISFQTLLNDYEEISSFLSDPNVKAMLVLDEAHYIKQIGGSWANAALTIAPHAEYRMILTGTPMPKSYSDLFNMFHFLFPENTLIDEETKFKLNECEKNSNLDEATNILEQAIGPFFYRVRKSELELKPQLFTKPQQIKMNPIERKVYDAIFKNIMNYCKDDYLKNIEIVSLLRKGRMMRLRQSLSFTGLLNSALENYTENLIPEDSEIKNCILNYDSLEIPAKIEQLLKMIREFNSNHQKVVIWSNFIRTINYIQEILTLEGFYCKKIIGETPFEKMEIRDEVTREKIRDEFVDSKSGLDILIANPAACAESISLHKTCSNAIYYDLSYNCGQYLQSLDRIHRVGGSEEKSSYYHYLQYSDTMEKDILKNLNLKSDKMYQIIDRDYGIYTLDMFEEDDDDELNAYSRIFH